VPHPVGSAIRHPIRHPVECTVARLLGRLVDGRGGRVPGTLDRGHRVRVGELFGRERLGGGHEQLSSGGLHLARGGARSFVGSEEGHAQRSGVAATGLPKSSSTRAKTALAALERLAYIVTGWPATTHSAA